MQRRWRLKVAAGTTLATMAASTSSRFRPLIVIRLTSHTAYSSAVRRPSVAIRHWPLLRSPSKTAQTTFVLPASIARSISVALGQSIWGGGEPPGEDDDAKAGKNTSPAVIR